MIDSVDSHHQKSDSSQHHRSWRYVSIMRLIRPRHAAAQSHHIPVWLAFIGHLAIGFTAFATCVTIVAFVGPYLQNRNLTALEQFLYPWGELIGPEGRRFWNIMEFLLACGMIELAFILAALCGVAWGARDERLRDSFAHAFRQTWLHTANVALIAILCTLAISSLMSLRDSHARQIEKVLGPYPKRPTTPRSPVTNDEWRTYQKESQEHWDTYQQLWEQSLVSPLFRHSEGIYGGLCLTTALVTLTLLFTLIGIDRRNQHHELVPLCDRCGYNLSVTPITSLCPECGLNVRDSLGYQVRLGTAWEREYKSYPIRAWLQTARLAIFKPKTLGRQFKTRTLTNHHHLFWLPTLISIFLISYMGVFTVTLVMDSRMVNIVNWTFVFFILPMTSCIVTLILFVLTQLNALFDGLWLSYKNKRNLLGAASRAATYCSAYLILSTLVAVCIGIGATMIIESRILESSTDRYFAKSLIGMAWACVCLILLLIQSALTRRAIRAAQYANK